MTNPAQRAEWVKIKVVLLLGHPKKGLYNSAEQKTLMMLSVCLMLNQSYNRLIPF